MPLRKMLFVLFIVLLLPSVPCAWAQDSLPQNVLTEITVYGIMRGDENGDLHLEQSVTRAEFSAMLVRALKIDNLPVSAVKSFDGVEESDWFYADVMRLTQCGVLNGYPDGSFRPLEHISTVEAVKSMTAALGYTAKAEERGGYPAGYLFTAAELGITKNIPVEDAMTRADVAQMIYNSLDVPLIDTDAIRSSGEIIYKVGETCLRDYHLYSDENGAQIKRKGILEANAESWLRMPYNNLRANQVVIDGNTYNVGETDAYRYLGMEVEYYAVADSEDGPYTLISIAPTKKNEAVTMTEHEYAGLSGNGAILGDMDGEDKTSSFALAKDHMLVKNFRKVQIPMDTDYSLARGTVKLIDNDGDGSFDIVIIEEFESVLAESADENSIWFRKGSFRDKQALPLFEKDVIYSVVDASGEYLAPEEIPELSVVSVSANESETVFKIRVQSEKLSGRVEEIGDDYLKIDDTTAPFEKGAEIDVSVGDTVDCYLNFRGEAAFTEISNYTDDYGYVIGCEQKGIGEFSVQMALSGRFTVDERKDLEEEDSAAVKLLKAHNSGVQTFTLRNKVKIGSERKTAEEAVAYLKNLGNPIVRYVINENGEIVEISIPEMVGNDVFGTNNQRTYNGNELVFGGLMNFGAFGVTDSTRVLCVPKNGVGSKDDYLASIEMLNGSSYTVNGYDMLSEGDNVRLIAVQTEMDYETGYGADENKTAILESVSQVLDDEGETVSRLTFWSQGKQMSYVSKPEVASGLRSGDVFLYSLGVTNDEIMEVEKIASLSDDQPRVIPLRGTARYGVIGLPVTVERNRISEAYYRRVDNITVSVGSTSADEYSCEIYRRNGPSVYVYDSGREEVRVGSVSDIIPGSSDKVFYYTSSSKIRIVVIVR